MRYELTFLDDKEFESLPYLDTHTSLGLADTKKGKAYVRRTGVKAVDVFTAMHELEHLEGDKLGEHDRYGNGVYYKDFGSALSGAGQSIGGAFNSLGSGISNLAGSATKAMGFGGGFQGGANPQGGMAAAAASNPALRAPANYFASAPGSTITSPFTTGMASMAANMPQFRAPTMGSTQGMAGPQMAPMSSSSQKFPISASATPTSQGETPAPQQTQTQSGGGLNLDLMKTLGGGALALFGNKMGGGSKLPDMSQLGSVQAFKNYDLRGQMNQLDPGLEAAINRDFDQMDQQEQHDFQSRWKNIRPGADIESDSVYKRDYQNLLADQQQRRADAMSKYRFDYVKTQLGINELEAQRLQTLAQLDVDTISMNTGLDNNESMQLKQMFTGVGTNMLSAGLGIGGNNLSFSGAV